MKVLVTCPPMLGMIDEFRARFEEKGIELDTPEVIQVMSEEQLIDIMPQYDGWIIGDDPATRKVFESGKSGNLRAAVKWGIGVDNVDFSAAADLDIPIINTPDMFGREVADTAMAYITGLARSLFWIDREVRAGNWPKPTGLSLKDKTVGLVGFGDIGKNLNRRLGAADMRVIAYDPAFREIGNAQVSLAEWPQRLGECDFIVLTCSLNKSNRHMLDAAALAQCKPGVYVINVARGPLIDESALLDAIESGRVAAAALDVMEVEPLPRDSGLRGYQRCVFGSHNGSNTADAVIATSHVAIDKLFGFLGLVESK